MAYTPPTNAPQWSLQQPTPVVQQPVQPALTADSLMALLSKRGNVDDDVDLAKILAPLGADERAFKRQLAYGEGLRDSKDMPKGQNSTGRVFTASSPLEFAAKLGEKWLGHKEANRAEEQLKGIPDRLIAELDRRMQERKDAEWLAKTRERDALKEQQMMAEGLRLENSPADLGGSTGFLGESMMDGGMFSNGTLFY